MILCLIQNILYFYRISFQFLCRTFLQQHIIFLPLLNLTIRQIYLIKPINRQPSSLVYSYHIYLNCKFLNILTRHNSQLHSFVNSIRPQTTNFSSLFKNILQKTSPLLLQVHHMIGIYSLVLTYCMSPPITLKC